MAVTALRGPQRLCWLVLDERSCTRLGARASRGLPDTLLHTLRATAAGTSWPIWLTPGTWTSRPSTRTTSGLSLHESASMGHPDCVLYLLARGAAGNNLTKPTCQ